MIKNYLENIVKIFLQGDAREESYYSSLEGFIKSFAQSINKSIQITTIPKKTEAGNPDFRIWDGSQHIIGYIEAKKPNENLNLIEESKQLRKYRATFPNLILTDFNEFRLYRNGVLIQKTNISKFYIAERLRTQPILENEQELYNLLENFLSFTLPKVYTAETLATELAKRTSFLRDQVISNELEEEEKGKGILFGFYNAFKQYLVGDLTQKSFADIYSQTVTYGLFAARSRANENFNRKVAFNYIPKTIGILRDVFQFISLGKLSPQMEVIIDDIAEVLQVADIKNILNEYYKKGKGKDPIVHFYETFLNVYDPETREKRGVYYTPEAVVKYILNGVHNLLKSEFKLNDGLASKEIKLLDPAAGTLTFPAEAIRIAVKEYVDKYGEGGKNSFIKNQLLNNFFAFELMMAPYAIGHIKIGFLLKELGYDMDEEDRFKLYLTNTLDMEELLQTEIPGLGSLSEESHSAAKIKKDEPLLVIIGNPPYSGISANINNWTEKLLKENIDGIKSYYEVDGQSLKEKKLWLQDDYVKFLRFAQWKINRTGKGIVGMITNHSYLDNPTFRGMRQSLMDTFNEIYILDLHGSSLKKETTPEGKKDENVFDIRQGVCISLFVKLSDKKNCKVYHLDLFGSREEKYNWLEKNKFRKKDFRQLKPESPWYFFIPRDTSEIGNYNNWPRLNEIFPVNNVGIVTARDDFAISEDEVQLKNKIRQYRDLRISDEVIRETFGLKDTSTFKLNKFRIELSKVTDWDKLILPVLYRPFDRRFIYYSRWVLERPIYDTMKHLIKIKNNLSLISVRRSRSKKIWNFAWVSEIISAGSTSITPLDINYVFPLYVIPDNGNGGNGDLFNPPRYEPVPNLNEKLINKLSEIYEKKINPEQLLSYIYAILYSNIYREKYNQFLIIDFPRIPFVKDFNIFLKLSKLGNKLIDLHLLNDTAIKKTHSKFNGLGDNLITKIRYDEKKNYIWINENQYFDNVAENIWNYYVGGYKILEKYLKDRKNKEIKDPSYFCKIISAIKYTIELQAEIDSVIVLKENKLIKFN